MFKLKSEFAGSISPYAQNIKNSIRAAAYTVGRNKAEMNNHVEKKPYPLYNRIDNSNCFTVCFE